MFVVTRPPASLRCSTLECKSPPPQCPRPGARSAVVAKRVDWATTARVRRKRSGRRRRRNSTTLNKCGGIFVKADVGHVVKTKLPPGPLCDRTQARSRGNNRSKSTSSLCCRSTREEASIPGSSSSGSNMRGVRVRHATSGEHHGQTVSPTCPIRRDTCPCGAPEAHSAQHQLKICTTPDIFVLRGVDVQEGAHASPNTFVMCPGLGLHHTKQIIRPG